jgi:hypothetical protein
MRGCETMRTYIWMYGCVQARSFKWTLWMYASKIAVWRGWSRRHRASKCFQIEQLQSLSSFPLWQDLYQLQQQFFQIGLRVCSYLTCTFVFSPSVLFFLTLLSACTGSGCCEGSYEDRGKNGYQIQRHVFWLLWSRTCCHGKMHTQPGYNDQMHVMWTQRTICQRNWYIHQTNVLLFVYPSFTKNFHRLVFSSFLL